MLFLVLSNKSTCTSLLLLLFPLGFSCCYIKYWQNNTSKYFYSIYDAFFIIGFKRFIFSAYLLMRLTQSLIAEFAKTLPLLEDTVVIFWPVFLDSTAVFSHSLRHNNLFSSNNSLPELSSTGEKECYFYCPRDRKYRNSARPNRVTGAGFWKATGTDRPIYSSDGTKCIGLKKSLVFYRGKAAKGIKTDWMMHEFRLPSISDHQSSPKKSTFDKIIPPSVSVLQSSASSCCSLLYGSLVARPHVKPSFSPLTRRIRGQSAGYSRKLTPWHIELFLIHGYLR